MLILFILFFIRFAADKKFDWAQYDIGMYYKDGTGV